MSTKIAVINAVEEETKMKSLTAIISACLLPFQAKLRAAHESSTFKVEMLRTMSNHLVSNKNH